MFLTRFRLFTIQIQSIALHCIIRYLNQSIPYSPHNRIPSREKCVVRPNHHSLRDTITRPYAQTTAADSTYDVPSTSPLHTIPQHLYHVTYTDFTTGFQGPWKGSNQKHGTNPIADILGRSKGFLFWPQSSISSWSLSAWKMRYMCKNKGEIPGEVQLQH